MTERQFCVYCGNAYSVRLRYSRPIHYLARTVQAYSSWTWKWH